MANDSQKWTRNTWHDNKKLTVINFFAGPGVGKSTTAAELFARMKKGNHKVEFVHEVAKDYVWENWLHIFGEQDYIVAHQNRLIRRLTMHDIDYAIVDSSILLSLFYMPDDFPQSFRAFVKEAFDTYDNLNIFLVRSPSIPYITEGRNETYDQAVEKDMQIEKYFLMHNVAYHRVPAGDLAADLCYEIVRQHVKPALSS